MTVQWRVGRKIPKNLYKGDLDVGRMDTAELAAEVVDGMNRKDQRFADFLQSGGFRMALLEKVFQMPEPVDVGGAVEAMLGLAEQVLENFLFGNEAK